MTIYDLRNLIVAIIVLSLACGALWKCKADVPGAFWAAVTLAGLCVAVVVWEVAILVRNRQREAGLREWAIKPLPSFELDYFRVGPYGSADFGRYKRLDGTDAALIAWVRSSREPLLYLSGVSGAGKSSLLNASLIPQLEQGEVAAGTAPFFALRLPEPETFHRRLQHY